MLAEQANPITALVSPYSLPHASQGGALSLRLGIIGANLTAGVALVAVVTSLAIAQPHPALPDPGHWTTIWSDTFNGAAGTGINSEKWKYDVGYGIFGNQEVQTMTDSTKNIHLDGHGDLSITAIHNGGWTSGRIETINAPFAAPRKGELKVSASIKQPGVISGVGYWPAFWLLGPGSWPKHGEIDIFEDVNALSLHSAALHCGNLTTPNPDGTTGPCHEFNGLSSRLRKCPGCQTGYHTYTAIVDRRQASNEQIRWYLDGRQFFAVRESQIGTAAWHLAVDHGFSIILDLAIGGTYPNHVCKCISPTADTIGYGTMSVRYVSVSKWTPQPSRDTHRITAASSRVPTGPRPH
jgi:beta-glucanase (GH16 family)